MGQFLPGQKKPPNSGRRKGTPNRRSEILKELTFGSGDAIIRRLEEILPLLDPKDEASTLISLLPYFLPKRKAIEVSFESNSAPGGMYSAEERDALSNDPDAVELAEKLAMRMAARAVSQNN